MSIYDKKEIQKKLEEIGAVKKLEDFAQKEDYAAFKNYLDNLPNELTGEEG